MRRYGHPETIRLIADSYQSGTAEREAEAAWWRGDDLSFEAVLDRVARAETEDATRHLHQRRLQAAALERGRKALHEVAERLRNAKTFHELFEIIEAALNPVRGLGELAVYDVADRLRHRLGLESEHVIYLHAGARIGARRLHGDRLPRESAWGMLRCEVPVPSGLQHFSTHELEDILCLHKDDFFLSPEDFRSKYPEGANGVCGPRRPRC